MPPIYLGDKAVTVYKGDTVASNVSIGTVIVQAYT